MSSTFGFSHFLSLALAMPYYHLRVVIKTLLRCRRLRRQSLYPYGLLELEFQTSSSASLVDLAKLSFLIHMTIALNGISALVGAGTPRITSVSSATVITRIDIT